MSEYGNVHHYRMPWWIWIIITVGLGEIGWFAKTVLIGNEQSAITATEIAELQKGQGALTGSLTALDSDVQTLNVNVAVLTQQIKDQKDERHGP